MTSQSVGCASIVLVSRISFQRHLWFFRPQTVQLKQMDGGIDRSITAPAGPVGQDRPKNILLSENCLSCVVGRKVPDTPSVPGASLDTHVPFRYIEM